MALTDESGTGMVMPVAPAYGGGNSGFGFGGDWAWILLLLVLFGGGWNNGFGGGFGGGDLYPWMNNSQHISDGFRDQMLSTNIASISDKLTSGFGDISTQLCSGVAGVTNGFNQAQISNLQSLYGIQSQLQQCCCDNRAATADLKYTVATEACADRSAVTDALREVIAANTASTQRVLDQLCADKIEEKNDIIAQLRSELLYARGQSSQDIQTAAIQAGQRALANEVEQYINPTPRPAYVVANPYCCQNYSGCGCGV